MSLPDFDYVIVGGGAAGCVLANRLSARSTNRVLLVEAGKNVETGKEPSDILSRFPLSYYNPQYKWHTIRGHWKTKSSSPEVIIEQGKVLGGSSSIMGMIALRGIPQDYDRWEALGATGWGWKNVLPFFRKLETDLDFEGPMHGNNGPTIVSRNPSESWPPVAHAALQLALRQGLTHVRDANVEFDDGICTLPIAASKTVRSSSVTCYLTPKIRARANLKILTETYLESLVFDGRKITGIKILHNDWLNEISAKNVILTAGALQTPVILLRAGIGNASELQRVGTTVRLNRPGVGRNLQNHAAMFLGAYLKPEGRDNRLDRNHNNIGFRFSSGLASAPASDMFAVIQNRSAWHALGSRVLGASTILHKPASRGSIRLTPDEPQKPLVEFNFLESSLDLDRLKSGLLWTIDLLKSPEVSKLTRFSFPVIRADKLRQLNVRTFSNKIKTTLASQVFDAAPKLGRSLFSRLIAGPQLESLVQNDRYLIEHISQNISGLAHHAGTCRMGSSSDPMAVVDSSGLVHEMDGLYVADASVMPEVPSGNTFLPTVMVAEKISESLLGSH